jgi:hypothetical protein
MMNQGPIEQRLSWISTAWTVLEQAHRDPEDARTEARRTLLERDGGAVHRYLPATLRLSPGVRPSCGVAGWRK